MDPWMLNPSKSIRYNPKLTPKIVLRSLYSDQLVVFSFTHVINASTGDIYLNR